MPPARRSASHASRARSPAERCRSSRWTAAPASGLGSATRALPGLHHPASRCPLPAARDGPLTDGAAACEYTMRFVRVPELTAEPARQRDEPPGNPMVRYRSSSCQANITFDADRTVTPCQDHRERAGPGS